MSRIGDIRTALAGVLAGASGIGPVLSYPPGEVTSDGTAWIGYFDTAVADSQRTVDMHVVPVTVCVSLNLQHDKGLIATEPLIDTARAVIRGNQGLGGLTDRVQVVRVLQAVFGEPASFIGFQLTLQIKESYGVSFSE